jgi:hypothetical protein
VLLLLLLCSLPDLQGLTCKSQQQQQQQRQQIVNFKRYT